MVQDRPSPCLPQLQTSHLSFLLWASPAFCPLPLPRHPPLAPQSLSLVLPSDTKRLVAGSGTSSHDAFSSGWVPTTLHPTDRPPLALQGDHIHIHAHVSEHEPLVGSVPRNGDKEEPEDKAVPGSSGRVLFAGTNKLFLTLLRKKTGESDSRG